MIGCWRGFKPTGDSVNKPGWIRDLSGNENHEDPWRDTSIHSTLKDWRSWAPGLVNDGSCGRHRVYALCTQERRQADKKQGFPLGLPCIWATSGRCFLLQRVFSSVNPSRNACKIPPKSLSWCQIQSSWQPMRLQSLPKGLFSQCRNLVINTNDGWMVWARSRAALGDCYLNSNMHKWSIKAQLSKLSFQGPKEERID